MSIARRNGFTWVELLVVICVLALLMAMLLPALQQQRGGHNYRGLCNSNLHNLALAVTGYAAAKGELPGYLEPLRTQPDGSQSVSRVTWLVPLLPYLERTDIYDLYRAGDYLKPGAPADFDPRRVYMNILTCPSSAKNDPHKLPVPPCNYVVNTGRADVFASAGGDDMPGYPNDGRANGVFFNHYRDGVVLPDDAPLVKIDLDYITVHDGSSLTVMMSERIDTGSYSFPPASALDTEAALGFVWWPSTSNQPPYNPPLPLPAHRINGPDDTMPINNARPTSKHPTGVNVAFCDGHTRFVSEDIDYGVWCLLLTPHGAEANTPGQVELAPAGPSNNYKYLREKQIDESMIGQ